MKRLERVREHSKKSIMMLSMTRIDCRIKDATKFVLISANSVIETTNGAAIFINILPKNTTKLEIRY
jgi:hypothetical protein